MISTKSRKAAALISDTISLAEVRSAIEEARARLEACTGSGVSGKNDPADLLTLLNRCRELSDATRSEPIRTIHHFACTGGTVIAKCLASMPNTQVLSEVDPLSSLDDKNTTRFCPTDLIWLARLSTRGATNELVTEIFLRGISAILDDSEMKGQRLIIRDHSHSHYCMGDQAGSRKTLREILEQKFRCLSVMSVRHPLDSFLSLRVNGWDHFSPKTLDEYCKRYMLFLSHNRNVPVYRYEDFVAQPKNTIREICERLQISYNSDFSRLFYVYSMSGDSGRCGEIVERRPRRKIPDDVIDQIDSSKSYPALCTRLGYM